jgi:hypothetical protein
MLTTLATIKTRLALNPSDTQYDTLLTNAIAAVSARFDKETNRTLARTENATHEFTADETEIIPACYPIETVTKFELKTTEADGWKEQADVPFLIRKSCIITLAPPFCILPSSFCIPRVTYTGGYLLPGSPPPDPPVAACQGLPDDLEQAAVEQVAFWFQNRGQLGLDTIWPHAGTYQKFADQDLLQSVQAVLKRYQRWSL